MLKLISIFIKHLFNKKYYTIQVKKVKTQKTANKTLNFSIPGCFAT